MDTIHYVRADGSRFYLYALINLYSRQAYAYYSPRLSWQTSLRVLELAQTIFQYHFKVIQTDNGPEFRNAFSLALQRQHTVLRHARVRTHNDNAHIERFNRTLQEECFARRNPQEKTAQRDLDRYLDYYNYRRLHLGLQLQTPVSVAKVVT